MGRWWGVGMGCVYVAKYDLKGTTSADYLPSLSLSSSPGSTLQSSLETENRKQVRLQEKLHR